VTGGAVILILLVLAAPIRDARFVLADEMSLPRDGETARVARSLEAMFPELSTDALYVVSPSHRMELDETERHATNLSLVPGVLEVESAAGTFREGSRILEAGLANRRFQSVESSWMNIPLAVHPQSETAVEAAAQVRDLVTDDGLLVGGASAHLLDTRQTVRDVLPWTVTIVVVSTFMILLLFTGSIVIPIKAIALNILGLAATFGALVWIFQEGRLQWLIGDFQVSGAMELTSPIVMFCVAFGLSTDYELFLLSRIKEERDGGASNAVAVARGLQRSGPVVTNAAALFIVVMLALVASPLGVVKVLGVGLALAVFLDATLIRAVLVPAFMKLAGTANWWAPRWLVRLHGRFGLAEHVPALPAAAGLRIEEGLVSHPLDAGAAVRLRQ
jgi:putative drug exporter of the RND superfamily